jgi:Mn-dependent DtxR family transcriptional regulator
MGKWSFLTNHARVLACIARDPGVRMRDVAASLGITERSASGIVADLTTSGYVIKGKEGRRNRYGIQVDVPLRRDTDRHQTIGELLAVLVDSSAGGVTP